MVWVARDTPAFSGFPRLNLNQIPYFFHTFSILFPTATLKKKKTEKNFFAPILNRRQKILTALKKFNEKLKFPYLFKNIWQFHTYSMISSDHFQFHTISMISMISSKRGNPVFTLATVLAKTSGSTRFHSGFFSRVSTIRGSTIFKALID
jgi:hypothetical protein